MRFSTKNSGPIAFWIAPNVNGRNAYITLAEANGGVVVDSQDQATILLVDRMSKLGGQMVRIWGGTPGKKVLDAQWLDECISKGRLLMREDHWGGWRASKVQNTAARDVPGVSKPPMISRFQPSSQTPLGGHGVRVADLGERPSSDASVPGTPSSTSTKLTDEVSRPTPAALPQEPVAGPSAGLSRKRKSKLAKGLFTREGVSLRFCVTHEVGNRTDVVKMIEDNGGKVIGSASVDGANFAILPLPLHKLQHCTEQIVQADKDGIPIVKKSWIEESVEEDKLLDYAPYINDSARTILQKQHGLNKSFAPKPTSQVGPSSTSLPRPPTPNHSPTDVGMAGFQSSLDSSTSAHNATLPEAPSIPTQTPIHSRTRNNDFPDPGINSTHIHPASRATRGIVPSNVQTTTSRPTSWAAPTAVPLQINPTNRELEPNSVFARSLPQQDPPSSPIDEILPAIKIPTAPAVPSTPVASQETRSSLWQNAGQTQHASQSPVTPTALAASGHQLPTQLTPLEFPRLRNYYTDEEDRSAIAYCREQLIEDSSNSHARMARGLARMYPRHTERGWHKRLLSNLRAELALVAAEAAAIRELRYGAPRSSHVIGGSVPVAGPSSSSLAGPGQPPRRPPPSPSSTPSLLKRARVEMAAPPTPVLPTPMNPGPSRPPPGPAPSQPPASSSSASPLTKPTSTSATSPSDTRASWPVAPPVAVPVSSSSANYTTLSGTSPYERDLHTIVDFFANMDESIVDSDMAWDALPSVVKHSCETQATWEAFYSQHEDEIVRLVTEGD
ncbi:hypothetical protein CYLTODRAFT_408503 [Cylindrobasidium torrendii FP15055 ss-10]|uniref:BRCT domain-containing protein n=1 Tax=Cylindrobasidium torrendii FP15055 ss-10 TaxID=1314674 RepID=A0A0D7BKD4_9AGAR|nr:hypothetical protein CYLTODRAFT_408503 [Cylindrobasidium torrendii FP15055 ss-10]